LNRSKHQDSRTKTGYTLAAILLLGSWLLRIYNLGEQSLWFDEGWSWHLARMPLAEMALTTAGDRSPPLYYALLHAWIGLAGQSEFAMRFISAMADTATIALVIALTSALLRGLESHASPTRSSTAPRSAAPLIAGAIYAVCPFAVWYAQETRMYALVAALCTASSYWLWRWLQRTTRGVGRETLEARRKTQDARRNDIPHIASSVFRLTHPRYLIASAMLLALAIYSHYYAIFLLPAHFLVVLIASQRGRLSQFSIFSFQFLVAAICIIASLVPWLLIASVGFAYDDGFFFPLNTIGGRLLEWVRSFASGGLGWPLPDGWAWLLAGASALGIAGLASRRRWRELAVLLALIVGPLLAATIAVRVVYPYRSVFHPRYLIYVVPMACALFGATGALTVHHSSSFIRHASSSVLRLASIVLVGILWLPALRAYLTDPALQRDDTRGAVQHVVEAIEPGDLVVMSRDNFAVTYYWPADQANALIALPPGLHGVLASDEAVLAALNDRQPQRVRLMLWQDDVVDPQRFVESTLWPNGYEIGEFNFAQIRLPLYRIERRPVMRPDFRDAGVVFGEPGERIALKRYWQRVSARVGDWFYVILEWEAQQPMRTDYKVFVHVVGADDRPVFQSDRLPLSALLPMTRWQPGEVMRDAHAMVAPADLPPGIYRVLVGVYDPATGRRLPAYRSDRALGEAMLLGKVEVTPP